MADFLYPTSAELRLIEQDLLPRMQAQRPIFGVMPLTSTDAHLLEWEQEDNWTGLQGIRGLGGAPPRVKKVGLSRFLAEPGIYGEFIDIDEIEMTARRQFGSFGQPADISDLVMRAQNRLIQRRLDRIESLGWALLTAGTYSVSGPTGTTLATDTYSIATLVQAGGACSDWHTPSTATPLLDFRNAQLKQRGHSVRFDASAKAFMNLKTFNYMIANTNTADLYGRRVTGLATVNSEGQLNALLQQDNLPQVVVYDDGYLNDSSTFVSFIPDDVVALVGTRPGGTPIAEYRFTRNSNNPNAAPGPYMKVVDLGETQVPRSINVHDGHNGGPVVYYPSAIVAMTTH